MKLKTRKQMLFKDFIGINYLTDKSKTVKVVIMIFITLLFMLLILSLSYIYESNIKTNLEYLNKNMAYFNDLDEDELKYFECYKYTDKIYKTETIKVNYVDAHNRQIKQSIKTFQNVEQIKNVFNITFLTNNFDGIVLLEGKEKINRDLIGKEVKLLDKSGNIVLVPIVNIGINVYNFQFFDIFSFNTYYEEAFINVNYCNKLLVEETNNTDYIISFNKEIDKEIDYDIKMLLGLNIIDYIYSPSYESYYAVTESNISSTHMFIDFMNVLSLIFTTFALVLLIFLFILLFDLKENEIRIRLKLNISKKRLFTYILLGGLFYLIVLLIVSYLLYLGIMYIFSYTICITITSSITCKCLIVLLIYFIILSLFNAIYSYYLINKKA